MVVGAGLDGSARERVVREEKTPADREPARRVLPPPSGQVVCRRVRDAGATSGYSTLQAQSGLSCGIAAAIRLPLTANSGVVRGVGQGLGDSAGLEVSGSRGATENIPYRRGSPETGQESKFPGGAHRDRSRARPSAVVGRRGDYKESVRCRNGPRRGPGYRQHRVPGIWGQSGTLWGMVSVLRYRECAICRAGRGGWGLDSVREIGTRSVGLSGKGDGNAQALHRSFRRGGGRQDSREMDGRPRQFDYYSSARRCARDIDGVGSLRGFD